MKKIVTFLALTLLLSGKSWAQQPFALDPVMYHVFDKDSLKGFDEDAARRSAISENFTGAEFPVRMYQLKRQYINDKFNLWPKVTKKAVSHSHSNYKSAAAPGCVNEDFEEATATATVTTPNQINGWTITRGTHQGNPGANSCNLNGCCPNNPSESAVFVVPNGLIDPVIGACYPIYSVFGTNPGSPNGAAVNPQIPFQMKGSNFIRINSSQNNYSIEKLSKTFAVTNQNALFQFAFISVFFPGHGCCDAGAFKIQLPGIPCPTFSASALSSACSNTANGITYLKSQSCDPATTSGGSPIFNKWQVASMDLTQYIGQSITIDIVATDCTAGGHYGYVYFDAQCGPMTIYGNGIGYPATTTSVVVPTCGAAGATMCASSGLGPYSWAGPNVPLPLTIPHQTNICYTSSISATYTLYMNPPGSCVPIERQVTSTITPAPLLAISAVQALCGNTLAVVSITPGGSAANPAFVTWSPTPFTINQSSTSAQYIIPAGPSPSVISVTASDPIGCLITSTINVLPAAPIPTFAVQNNTGQNVITCRTPTLDLMAVSGYTYGTLTYFWASPSYTSTQSSVTVSTGGVFTVTATDAVSQCSKTQTINILTNTVAPTSIVSPTFQNITCSSTAVADITLTSTSPTVNISHNILSPLGGTFTSQSYSVSYQAGGPGVYVHKLVNEANGCSVSRQFTIASNSGFPTFSLVSSPSGFTVGCNQKSVTIVNMTGGDTSPGGGAVSYTLLTPGSATLIPSNGLLGGLSTFSLSVPGTYTAITRDNVTFCDTRIPFSILSNTLGPKIDTVAVPYRVLDCYKPNVLLVGASSTENVKYQWGFQGTPGLLENDTILVESKPATPTATFVNNYTLTITDNNSTCKSTTIVPIYQNLFVPKAIISNGGTSALSCNVPTIMLSNSSQHTIPSNNPVFPAPSAPVVASLWEGPSPQVSFTLSSTYIAQVPGTYTMHALDKENGCTSFTTILIGDNLAYPLVNNPDVPAPSVLDCGSQFAKITPIVSSATAGLSYSWTAPATATIQNQNTATLTTNQTGEYNLIVTNTVNGCATAVNMSVIDGTLKAGFEVEPGTSGFAPFTASFKNTSSTSLGSGSITSVWSFGNGTSATYSSVATATAVFKTPGTYTIALHVAKGSCRETVYKTITVEMPSALEVPNVFTPNGDGVNDFYFLKTTGLSEIVVHIYDRWGHLVYELTTDRGNISWDGKNQLGKDVAEGTYFYTLTAKGKDGKAYDTKGTISLYR